MTSFDACVPLATTGSSGIIFLISLALLFTLGGVALSLFSRGTNSKVAVLSAGFLVASALVVSAPAPALAQSPLAPTAVTAPAISNGSYDFPTDAQTVIQQSPASWTNPEGCGSLTYQWQIQTNLSGVLSEWTNYGDVLTSLGAGTPISCTIPNQGQTNNARLVVNLGNSYGSAQSISQTLSICPRG